MSKRNVEKMDKSELRAACKAAGISYSKLTVAGMREALLAKQAPAPVVITTPAPEAAAPAVPASAAAAPVVLSGKTTPQRESRNGIRRPAPGGLCAAVWEALDQMHAAKVEITAQAVRDLATAKAWNQSNASIEFYGWRRWMGLSKPRANKEKKPRAKAKEAAPAVVTEAAAAP